MAIELKNGVTKQERLNSPSVFTAEEDSYIIISQ